MKQKCQCENYYFYVLFFSIFFVFVFYYTYIIKNVIFFSSNDLDKMIEEQRTNHPIFAHLDRPKIAPPNSIFFPNRPVDPAIEQQQRKEMDMWFPNIVPGEEEQHFEDLDDIVQRNATLGNK